MTRKFKYTIEEDSCDSGGGCGIGGGDGVGGEEPDRNDILSINELSSDDNDELASATMESDSSIDGDYETEKYDDMYIPFRDNGKKVKKPIQIVGECSLSLQDIFNSMSKMTVFKIPKKFCLRTRQISFNSKDEGGVNNSQSVGASTKKTKLCRSLLTNKMCSFGATCKFAHLFCQITKCQYDHCKKIQLIGNGIFKNVNENSVCRLRHNLETIDSFILRTNETTLFDINIEVFSEFISDVFSLIQKNRSNVINMTVI